MKKSKDEIAFLIVTGQKLSQDQIGGLSQDQIGGLSRYQIGGLSQDQIGGLSRYQIGGLSQDQIGWLSQDQIGGLSQDQIGGLSRYQIGGLSQDQIGWLSQDQIGGLSQRKELFKSIPKLHKPYTKINDDLKHNRRQFKQSTFGPEGGCKNLCETPMCIAGHLVNLAGEIGWKLRKEFGFAGAAALIHAASHPKIPCPNFGSYSDELAVGFIRHMAKLESKQK